MFATVYSTQPESNEEIFINLFTVAIAIVLVF
jgi:hypothetical protein